MSEDLKVTQPHEVAHATRLIQLPSQQNGVDIVLRIGARSKLEIMEIMGGIHGVAEEPGKRSFDALLATVRDSIGPEKQLAALGIIEPAFSFEVREAGKVFWDDLTIDNQAHTVNQILDLSGWGKGGRVERDKTFPAGVVGEGQARGSDVPAGGGDGGAVPDGGVPAA